MAEEKSEMLQSNWDLAIKQLEAEGIENPEGMLLSRACEEHNKYQEGSLADYKEKVAADVLAPSTI